MGEEHVDDFLEPVGLPAAESEAARMSRLLPWLRERDEFYADAALAVWLYLCRLPRGARVGCERTAAFLHTVARRAIVSGMRRRHGRHGSLQHAARVGSLDAAAEVFGDSVPRELAHDEPCFDAVESRAVAAEVVPALVSEVLSRDARRAVVDYFLRGRRLADIGRDLGVSESRASQLVKTGLRHMRAAAHRRGIDPTDLH